MDKRILVIKHVAREGAGLIGGFFEKDGWEIAVVELELGERLPDSPDEYAAIVVMGGPMNVYETDSYPFLEEEEHLIRKALIAEIPVLGICLGAQLLAKTCGARVKKAAHREIGWYGVDLTGEGAKDSLFKGLPRRLNVFQWHEDTFEVPSGGALLVRGKPVGNQAFRVGRNAYGLQFHLEVTLPMIGEWMKGESGIDGAKIMNDGAALYEAFEAQALQFLANFKGLVESSARVRMIIRLFVEGENGMNRKRRAIPWWDKRHGTSGP